MAGRTFIARGDGARQAMVNAWRNVQAICSSGGAAKITVSVVKSTRTLEQNAKLWAVLSDIAEQVKWPVNGSLQYMSPEDWKDLLSAGLKQDQRVAQGIGGGFVMLGQRTSKMTIDEMVELIELAHAFGTERGVRWGDVVEEQEAA